MSNDDLRLALARAHDALFASITGLTEEQFRRRCGDNEWSISEILAHIAAARRRVGMQVRQMLDRQNVSISGLTDEERRREASQGRRLPPPQIIHDLIGSYRRISEMLAGLAEDELWRMILCSGGGVLTIADLLRQHIQHELEHVAQIWACRAAFIVADGAREPTTARAGEERFRS